MTWRENRLVQPALRAGRGLRRRIERLLTSELRRELAAVSARQDELLARLDAMAAVQVRTLEQLRQGSLPLDALGEPAGAGKTQPRDPGAAWQDALRGLGVLNYENDEVSGERRFLKRYLALAPRAVVLDIGANEGQFAELCRACGPEAVIHSVEPHPRAHAVLAGKAGRLGVFAHCLALSDSEGEAAFYDYADEQGSQHASLYREVIEEVHRRPASAVRVRCTTLDRFLPQLGLERIGLLKIDTEGHELAVLKGAHDLLARDAIDVIEFEFNEMNVISRVFMKDFFDLLPGFRLFRLLSGGAIELARYDPRSMEIFAFQNIVAVRRDLDAGWLTAADPA